LDKSTLVSVQVCFLLVSENIDNVLYQQI